MNDFASGTFYQYRLKTINDNGSFQYSDVIYINIPTNEELNIYPNPSHNNIQCHNSGTQTLAYIQLVDVMGKSLLNKMIPINEGNINIPVSGIKSGNYFINMKIGNKQYNRQVCIIQ